MLQYFEHRTTSGTVEGINNRLKLIKRSGYGSEILSGLSYAASLAGILLLRLHNKPGRVLFFEVPKKV
ncbi:hypothetical protein C7293_08710 [filamentous cyanobacterium CCT1]|nr:hypothetical protein C7293_08710 [filamentous cyanobacterium CCT1]PSN81109.1 hypothetical protein C8B47_03070 [filamentous cyanobacterium CCP4]